MDALVTLIVLVVIVGLFPLSTWVRIRRNQVHINGRQLVIPNAFIGQQVIPLGKVNDVQAGLWRVTVNLSSGKSVSRTFYRSANRDRVVGMILEALGDGS